jgi:hypothetical protein
MPSGMGNALMMGWREMPSIQEIPNPLKEHWLVFPAAFFKRKQDEMVVRYGAEKKGK